MSAWPGTVPHIPLRDSFQFVSHQAPLKTEMSSGNVRLRRQFTLRVSIVKFAIRMTSAQLQTLETFVFDTLDQGTQKFTMPVWGPHGCVDKTCQLSDGTFSASPTGGGWNVTLQLNVENY
ncbi:MAG: hypothetical protein JWQ03_3230 [Variovorax sp.]|nr:hypothetical protein [Variovorax sp.]